MILSLKREKYTIKNGTYLIDALFSINGEISQEKFCREGRCKSCYSTIMNKGTTNMREVLSCQTKLYKDIRVLSLSKSLNP